MNIIKALYKEISKLAFWFTLLTSVALLTISFFLPPQGAVDPSIIASCGELLGFGTLATVIDALERGRKVSFNKGDVNMTVHDDDEVQDSGEYDQMKP